MSIHRRAEFCLQGNAALRFDGHFEDTVAMLGKELVGISDLIEFEAMREQWRQIQPTVKHHFHQSPHPFLPAWA